VPTDFEQYYLPPSDPDFNQKLEALISRFEQLCQFGRYGLNIALKLRENLIAPDIYDLKRLSREMVLLDNSIYQLELTTPELAPIATYFRLRKNSSEQDDLAYIANMAEILYRDLQTQAQIMMENLSAFTASQPQSLGVLLV
jgi:hypothetical protein